MLTISSSGNLGDCKTFLGKDAEAIALNPSDVTIRALGPTPSDKRESNNELAANG